MTDHTHPLPDETIRLEYGDDWRRPRPVQVYPAVLEVLTDPYELGAFVRVERWLDLRESVTEQRVADELFCGDLDRAKKFTRKMFELGAWGDSEEIAARELAARKAATLAAVPEPRKTLTAPVPWPEFTGETWSGEGLALRESRAKPWAAKGSRGKFSPRDTFVVYRLTAGKKLLYIGMSMDLRSRLVAHLDKPFDSWSAQGCRNKDECAWLEAEEIVRLRPPLNRDTTWLGGRAPLVPSWGKAKRRARKAVQA